MTAVKEPKSLLDGEFTKVLGNILERNGITEEWLHENCSNDYEGEGE